MCVKFSFKKKQRSLKLPSYPHLLYYCAFKHDMRNLVNFHRLKNSNFILESKMADVNQQKNSKQLDRPDAVRKYCFTLEKKKK